MGVHTSWGRSLENESKYLIEVSGQPKEPGDIERLIRILHRSVLRFDPDTKLNEVNFARIAYRLSWEGIPGVLYSLTMAQRVIEREIRKYLNEWEYSIKLNLIETGVDV